MLRGAAARLLRASASLRATASSVPSTSAQQNGSCLHCLGALPDCVVYPGPSCSSHSSLAVRWYAASPDPLNEPEEQRSIGNQRIHELVEEITQMNLLEIADLTELLRKRLNITAPPPGAFLGGMPGAPGGGAAPAVVAEAPKEAEKTEFDVKLTGFEAASKIKVIKEVRAVTSLGLKEAKELVEKAPVVIKAGLKKEEADELKKKLETAGGKAELE